MQVYIIYLFIYLFIYLSCFSFTFFFLPSAPSFWSRLPFLAGDIYCTVGMRGRLPFLAWEVDFILLAGFFHAVVILRACMKVAVAEYLWSVTVLTKDESPHTVCTFTPWVVSFTPPGIEHQAGGNSILHLFGRMVENHGIDSRYPDGTQLGAPIQVLALLDDRLTSLKRPCS